jgi:hypothetical protein
MLEKLPNEILVLIFKHILYARRAPTIAVRDFARLQSTSWRFNECSWVALAADDNRRILWEFIRKYLNNKNTFHYEMLGVILEKCMKKYAHMATNDIVNITSYNCTTHLHTTTKRSISYTIYYSDYTLKIKNIYEYDKPLRLDRIKVHTTLGLRHPDKFDDYEHELMNWLNTYGKLIMIVIIKNERKK